MQGKKDTVFDKSAPDLSAAGSKLPSKGEGESRKQEHLFPVVIGGC